MRTKAELLQKSKTIAVVGLSPKPDRPSYEVASYLKTQGYRIIPVNPNEKEVLGEKCYPDLLSIPEPVDTVDIFRRSEEVMPVVEQAIAIKASCVWMQDGVINEAAAAKARSAGLEVIMNDCIARQHRMLSAQGLLARKEGPPSPRL